MGLEIDLLKNYPKPKRNVSERAVNKNDIMDGMGMIGG